MILRMFHTIAAYFTAQAYKAFNLFMCVVLKNCVYNIEKTCIYICK